MRSAGLELVGTGDDDVARPGFALVWVCSSVGRAGNIIPVRKDDSVGSSPTRPRNPHPTAKYTGHCSGARVGESACVPEEMDD